jgi:hypothetical protein
MVYVPLARKTDEIAITLEIPFTISLGRRVHTNPKFRNQAACCVKEAAPCDFTAIGNRSDA